MKFSILETINNFFIINHISLLIILFLFPAIIIIVNNFCYNFKILDLPNERKLHKFPMPVSGGLVLVIFFVITFFFKNIFDLNFKFFFTDIIFFSIIFFVFGLLDDLKKFDTKLKIVLLLTAITLIVFFSSNYNLNFLRFKFIFDRTYILDYLSIPFTVFCIFMLFNALNYADGKNGIAISIGIYWIVYIFFKTNGVFFTLLEIALVLTILLAFNLKKKLFLGNSGVSLLSIFISFLIIKTYNAETYNVYCDEIFLLLFIPGLDAARVTVLRVFKKISPFEPDRNHLHHHLEKYLDEKFIWLVFLLLTILPIFILLVLNNFIISIIIPLFIYSFLLSNFFKRYN